jgi:hypothetical protein
MKRGCPNIQCLFYHKADYVIKDGSYYRQDDARHIKRFRYLVEDFKVPLILLVIKKEFILKSMLFFFEEERH